MKTPSLDRYRADKIHWTATARQPTA